jgi:hypothetical protein
VAGHAFSRSTPSRTRSWEYRAPNEEDLYTLARGAAQRLSNGNTLITESGEGRAFEVTQQCEVVWMFYNPTTNENGKAVAIVRERRLDGSGLASRRFPLVG